MKTLALLITIALTTIFSYGQETTESYTLTIRVNNVLNNNGHVLVGLHTSDTFMKGKGIQNAKAEIQDGKISVTFKDITPGTYAVMVMHDENDNQRMDLEPNGMPMESYGMSNNPMLYGPPTFADAKFELTKDTELDIRF